MRVLYGSPIAAAGVRTHTAATTMKGVFRVQKHDDSVSSTESAKPLRASLCKDGEIHPTVGCHRSTTCVETMLYPRGMHRKDTPKRKR